jgi:hypothetical protein
MSRNIEDERSGSASRRTGGLARDVWGEFSHTHRNPGALGSAPRGHHR